MATWYAQLNSQDFHYYHQWNSAANGSGTWLDTSVTDYSQDTFCTNGKIVIISTNITCEKLYCHVNGFFRFSGTGLVIHADIENDSQLNSIDIQPNSDVTIYGDLIANGTENGAIVMYQSNSALTLYGNITVSGFYSIAIRIDSSTAIVNIYDGILSVDGDYSECIINELYNDTPTLYVNNSILTGGSGVWSSAIHYEDGRFVVNNSTLIAGDGLSCEAVRSMSFPVILNECNLVSSGTSMPIAGSMIYTPRADNYFEIWDDTTPTILALTPDADNLMKGTVCGQTVGTLAPASPFRRSKRRFI